MLSAAYMQLFCSGSHAHRHLPFWALISPNNPNYRAEEEELQWRSEWKDASQRGLKYLHAFLHVSRASSPSNFKTICLQAGGSCCIRVCSRFHSNWNFLVRWGWRCWWGWRRSTTTKTDGGGRNVQADGGFTLTLHTLSTLVRKKTWNWNLHQLMFMVAE